MFSLGHGSARGYVDYMSFLHQIADTVEKWLWQHMLGPLSCRMGRHDDVPVSCELDPRPFWTRVHVRCTRCEHRDIFRAPVIVRGPTTMV